MRKLILPLVTVGLCLGMAGCIQQPYSNPYTSSYSSQPKKMYEEINYVLDTSKSSYSDKTVDVSITPQKKDDNYKYFTLTIVNKSKNDLKLSWNESYFLENDTANGGFMFDGVQYANRDAPKQDLLILPNTTITKDIYPTAKVGYLSYNRLAVNMGLPTGWVHYVLKDGVFGAYLKITGKKYDNNIKVVIGMSSN